MFSQHHVLLGRDTLLTLPDQDSLLVKSQIRQLIGSWISEGYIHADMVRSANVTDTLTVWEISRGKKYKLENIKYLSAAGDTLDENTDPLHKATSLANNGFPFSSFSLVDIRLAGEKVSVSYQVNPGPKVVFDSIKGIDNLRVKQQVFYNLMGFQPGDIYSEQLFQSIDDRITALPFVSITDPSDIGFYANKAVINMNAKYNRTGKFDAMLGVIPTGAANASNRLNGYIDMHLPNLFQSAIQLDLQWRAFGQQAQSIQAKTAIPVIGKTSIGLSFGGDILRQDSSFVNSQAGFRLWSGLTPRTRLSVGYDRAYSNRLSTDLDVYNSFGYDWYAIGLCRNCEYDIEQKSGGLNYMVSAKLGSRTLEESSISSLEKTLTFNGTLDLSWKKEIANQSMLFEQLRVGKLWNDAGLYQNEKYRLGGLSSIRGFAENQFFAEGYLYFNNEYRFYFEKQSYLFGLLDAGFIQQGQSWDTFINPGLGLTLSTNSGLFKFIFAQGRLFDQVNTTNNLIHFGYTAVF